MSHAANQENPLHNIAKPLEPESRLVKKNRRNQVDGQMATDVGAHWQKSEADSSIRAEAIVGEVLCQSQAMMVATFVSQQYDFIFSLCLPFSLSFTSLWVTWLYLVMGHMFSHMMRHITMAHDQSHDHGLFSLHTWVTMTLCFMFHLFLAYDSLYLISDSPESCHNIDSYCHIRPYSMMSLHTCTYLFLVHL